MSSNTVIPDGCPQWAVDLILSLRDFEIQLGNIMPPKGGEKGDDYISKPLAELVQSSLDVTNASTEKLFATITQKLTESGYSTTQIAAFINARVAPEAKLPYCNDGEVREALLSE